METELERGEKRGARARTGSSPSLQYGMADASPAEKLSRSYTFLHESRDRLPPRLLAFYDILARSQRVEQSILDFLRHCDPDTHPRELLQPSKPAKA